MKAFIDLYIKRLVKPSILKHLGFTAVVVEEYEKRVDNVDGLHIVRGILLSATRLGELKEKLRGIKEKYPIVLVDPLSVEVARFAAHDGRVDGIWLDEENIKIVDKAQINMMRQYSKPLIISIREYLSLPGQYKSMIYRRIKLAIDRGVTIIPVSGATSHKEYIVPSTMVYLLSFLFDTDYKYWIYTLASASREILLRNGVVP